MTPGSLLERAPYSFEGPVQPILGHKTVVHAVGKDEQVIRAEFSFKNGHGPVFANLSSLGPRA